MTAINIADGLKASPLESNVHGPPRDLGCGQSLACVVHYYDLSKVKA